jgi:Tol biopolymer transport system component
MRRCVLVALTMLAPLLPAPARAAVEPQPPRTILFSRTDVTGTHVFAIEPDGTGLTQLTFGGAKDVDPAWTSDASSITFTRRTDTGADTWIMDADGSDARLFLTNARSLIWNSFGAVAFVRSRNGNLEIWTAAGDGSDRVRVTDHPARDVQPAWTWDGRLAFVSDRSGRDRIYAIDLDGTHLVRLTSGPGEQRHPTSWQLGLMYEQDEGADRDIVRMTTLGGSVDAEVAGPADDRDPDAALDGELVFRRVRADGSSSLIHRWIDVDGTSTTLSTGHVTDRTPAWAPAFAWILAQDAQAQGNLLEAAGTAQAIRDDTGSFDAADEIDMEAANPSLTYVSAHVDSTGPETLSVEANTTRWAAAALSDSGTCYLIRLDDLTGTTYGITTASSCSGADASGAQDAEW